jgi:hypothetical protein
MDNTYNAIFPRPAHKIYPTQKLLYICHNIYGGAHSRSVRRLVDPLAWIPVLVDGLVPKVARQLVDVESEPDIARVKTHADVLFNAPPWPHWLYLWRGARSRRWWWWWHWGQDLGRANPVRRVGAITILPAAVATTKDASGVGDVELPHPAGSSAIVPREASLATASYGLALQHSTHGLLHVGPRRPWAEFCDCREIDAHSWRAEGPEHDVALWWWSPRWLDPYDTRGLPKFQ